MDMLHEKGAGKGPVIGYTGNVAWPGPAMLQCAIGVVAIGNSSRACPSNALAHRFRLHP